VSKILPWISLGLAGLALAIIVGIVVSNQAATRAGGYVPDSNDIGFCQVDSGDIFEARFRQCDNATSDPMWIQFCLTEDLDPSSCYLNPDANGHAGSSTNGGQEASLAGTCYLSESDGFESTLDECLGTDSAQQWCQAGIAFNDPSCEVLVALPGDDQSTLPVGDQGDCYYPNPEARFEATLDECQQEFGTIEWCPSGQSQGSRGCVDISSHDPGLCYFGNQNLGRAPERLEYDACSDQEGAIRWCPPGAESDAACVDIE
jgi:hypothetical protein